MAVFSLCRSLSASLAVLAGLWLSPVLSETFARDFRVGWVIANPDGAFPRAAIGVNGEWPVPTITATLGDRLILTVHNDLGNASTSLHFHGFFQNGTNHMDGAVGVNQCAIPPGKSFTYDIHFEQPGTYWYHAHNDGQYIDGLRGPIVVHDPNGPYEGKYDEELLISLSDWYHQQAPELVNELINVENPTGAEPVPQAALLNDTQNLKIPVKPSTTYLIHFVNVGGFASHFTWFEGHTMRIVEVDGVWTEEAEAERLYITPAQRYSVLLTTKSDISQNFAIVSAMDEDLFDVIPDDQNSNVTGWLVYDETKPLPEPGTIDDLEDGMFDDFDLVPLDGEKLFDHVDHSVTLEVKMDNLRDGANYAFFNDMTYVSPKVPSLYTALSVGVENASDPRVYGTHSLPVVIKRHDIIEIVLNNGDDGRHPFHLHGHNFQVIYRSEEDDGFYVEGGKSLSLPKVPMRRDTVYVQGNGNFVIRFRADNPGVWLFHCHIEWHMDQGLITTFIEAPEALQGLAIPDNHFEMCRSAGLPISGNAAGNKDNVFDLSGENKPPPPLPEGFTAKGYVALLFSTISGILGLAVITWYGLIDPNAKDTDTEIEPLIGSSSQAEQEE